MSLDQSTIEDLQLLVWLPVQRQGQWLDACLLYGGGHEIETTQVVSAKQMAAELRRHAFDLLVFWMEGTLGPAPGLCQQLMNLSETEGFVSLGMHAQPGWQHALLEAGAIACLDMDAVDPMGLVHSLRNACELVKLRQQKRDWLTELQRVRQRESAEVERLLAGQRQLVNRLDELGSGPGVVCQPFAIGLEEPTSHMDAQHLLATPLGHSYCAVLHNYLFDDHQVSGTVMSLLAEHFLTTGQTSSQLMRLHLAAITRVTATAGPTAMRHCLMTAERFLIELLMRIADRWVMEPGVGQSTDESLQPRGINPSSPLAAA